MFAKAACCVSMAQSSPKPPKGRHKKFADLWLSGVDAPDAYLQAGFKGNRSEAHARNGAGRLLSRADVQQYIQTQRREEATGESNSEDEATPDPFELKSRLSTRHRNFIETWLQTFDPEKACEAANFRNSEGDEARKVTGQILGRSDVQAYLKAIKQREALAHRHTADEIGLRLEPRHRTFADRYVTHFDRGRAYEESGYATASRSTSQKLSHRLLQRADVQMYIEARLQELQEKVCVDRDRVWQELGAIATARIDQVIDSNGGLRNWRDIPEWVRAAIASYERIPSKLEGEYTVKVKMHSKTSALSILSRFYGLDLNPDDLIARVREYGFDVTYRIDTPDGMPLVGDTGNANTDDTGNANATDETQ